MPKQPEGKLVAKIKKLAEWRGARSFKIVGSEESHQEVGIPDLLICYRGVFIGAEVKQPGAKLRPAQRVVLREIYDAGGIAAVLETVGQADKLLADIEQGAPHQGTYYIRGVYYYRLPTNPHFLD